jgi:hypothetical protein
MLYIFTLFILHRENGTLVDLTLNSSRAFRKMKVSITQSFELDGTECDVECDCRFVFFCLKTSKRESHRERPV